MSKDTPIDAESDLVADLNAQDDDGDGWSLHQRSDARDPARVGAVGTARLGELAGRLTAEEVWGIDAALLTVLGLR
jgi:hypothetical protein